MCYNELYSTNEGRSMMKIIRLSEYGILPDTDITASLFSLFEQNREDTEFVFENADYYLSPAQAQRKDFRISNSDITPTRTLAIFLKNMKNCVLASGAIIGMMAGLMGSVAAIMIVKNKMTLCEMLKCKTKDAFKQASEKFSF